jgi:hypothetical protein
MAAKKGGMPSRGALRSTPPKSIKALQKNLDDAQVKADVAQANADVARAEASKVRASIEATGKAKVQYDYQTGSSKVVKR